MYDVRLDDANGEGWQRKVCYDSDYESWIRPDGTECFANEVSGTTDCGELGPENPPMQVR